MTITDRLHLLTLKGYCPNLIYDDEGNWALSFSSSGSSWDGKPGMTSVHVEEEEWKPTIEEAVDYAIGKLEEE